MTERALSMLAIASFAVFSGCREPAGTEVPVPAAREAPRPELPRTSIAPGADSPWSSREACEKLVLRGVRAERTEGRLRVGTWNIRWFPDGRPGKRAQSAGTDLAWLGCAIAWMNLDVLVVQEFKLHAAAREKLAQLLALLDHHGPGKWRAHFDDCPNAPGQHVGILFNERRVAARAFQTLASVNPHGSPCQDQLRPGFGAYLRSAGGLDLHVISVHLKSGSERRAISLRQRSWDGLFEAYRQSNTQVRDTDVIFAGDFNSMGCRHCSPAIDPSGELAEFDKRLGTLLEPFRRVPARPSCSHYFGSQPTLLDHFVANERMRELPKTRLAEVSGDCAERGGEELARGERRGPVSEALSDHCPVLLELDDTDLD
jgi:endonuclease/exonuclease/phosphatase family metal-dependent hydrolase